MKRKRSDSNDSSDSSSGSSGSSDSRAAKKTVSPIYPLGIPDFARQPTQTFKLEMDFLSILDIFSRVLVISKGIKESAGLFLASRYAAAKARNPKFDVDTFIEILKKLQMRRIFPRSVSTTPTEQALYLYLSMHTPGVFIEPASEEDAAEEDDIAPTQQTPETILKLELRAKAKLLFANTIWLHGPSMTNWLIYDVLPMIDAFHPSNHKRLIGYVVGSSPLGLNERPVCVDFIVLNPANHRGVDIYSLAHTGGVSSNRCWRPARSGEFKMLGSDADDDPCWFLDDDLAFTNYPNHRWPSEWQVDFADIRGPVLHIDGSESTLQCNGVEHVMRWNPAVAGSIPEPVAAINDIVGTENDFAEGELFSCPNVYHILFGPGMDVRPLAV